MSEIKILLLKGDKKEMGQEYGRKLKNELKICLKLIKEYQVIQHHIPYEDIIECAEKFYYKYQKKNNYGKKWKKIFSSIF